MIKKTSKNCQHDWEKRGVFEEFTEQCRNCGAKCSRDEDGMIDDYEHVAFKDSRRDA